MESTDLQPLELPTRDDDWLDWMTERAQGGLSTAGAVIAALKLTPDGDETVLQLWNDARIALADVFAVSSLLSVVHPDAAVMEAAEAFQIEARAFSTDLHLDAEVFGRLASLVDAPLESGARRVLEDALRDFRRAGVDRDDETRERVRELSRRESELSQTFSRIIRDGRRTTSGAGRCPRRPARRLRGRAPRRGRARRDQHRLPRHAPVPHPLTRPRAAASRGP